MLIIIIWFVHLISLLNLQIFSYNIFFIFVEATGAASPPVSCGRSLPIAELSKELTHLGIGLFGPYPDAGQAVFWTGIKALVLTSKPGESGFVILHRKTAAGVQAFYATSPAPASGGTSAGKQPKFQPEDYRASIRGAFKGSCEERSSSIFISNLFDRIYIMSDCESSNSPPEVIQSCASLSRCDRASSIIICVLMQMREKLIFY